MLLCRDIQIGGFTFSEYIAEVLMQMKRLQRGGCTLEGNFGHLRRAEKKMASHECMGLYTDVTMHVYMSEP